MNSVFGSEYASAYDSIYRDKDYEAECDILEGIFKTYGRGQITSVIDMGCGTGGHALPLAKRGYKVTGVDRSQEMIAQARDKAADLGIAESVSFRQGDITAVDLQREFDAVLLMFAVLGYQTDDGDLRSTLTTARRHLRPGGLLIFDVWYGPAVLFLRPSKRSKTIPTPGGRLLRVASGELEEKHQICTVQLHVRRFEGEQLAGETQETHGIRYFFPDEIERLLRASGFSLVQMGGFPELEHKPDETTWSVLVVSRAAGTA